MYEPLGHRCPAYWCRWWRRLTDWPNMLSAILRRLFRSSECHVQRACMCISRECLLEIHVNISKYNSCEANAKCHHVSFMWFFTCNSHVNSFTWIFSRAILFLYTIVRRRSSKPQVFRRHHDITLMKKPTQTNTNTSKVHQQKQRPSWLWEKQLNEIELK